MTKNSNQGGGPALRLYDQGLELSDPFKANFKARFFVKA